MVPIYLRVSYFDKKKLMHFIFHNCPWFCLHEMKSEFFRNVVKDTSVNGQITFPENFPLFLRGDL